MYSGLEIPSPEKSSFSSLFTDTVHTDIKYLFKELAEDETGKY